MQQNVQSRIKPVAVHALGQPIELSVPLSKLLFQHFLDTFQHFPPDLPCSLWATLSLSLWTTEMSPQKAGKVPQHTIWDSFVCKCSFKEPLYILTPHLLTTVHCWLGRGVHLCRSRLCIIGTIKWPNVQCCPSMQHFCYCEFMSLLDVCGTEGV